MITHGTLEMSKDGAPFKFAELAGISCSICALKDVPQETIERLALDFATLAGGERWVAFDKSKLGIGGPTPNPCNQDPAGRLHWFLLSETAAAGATLAWAALP